MEKSYYLENITASHKKNPRRFLKPSDEEMKTLKVGELVRLFFVFNFKTEDGCRAERMWVEISEINGDNFKGLLTNKPVYIKDLNDGDVVEFTKDNIATIIVPIEFDVNMKAVITRRALIKKEVNWLVRDESLNEEDTGWQLFYGDEDQDYVDDPDNAMVISLADVLQFEPRLEKAFASGHNAFEWDDDMVDFVEVEDFEGPEEEEM